MRASQRLRQSRHHRVLYSFLQRVEQSLCERHQIGVRNPRGRPHSLQMWVFLPWGYLLIRRSPLPKSRLLCLPR